MANKNILSKYQFFVASEIPVIRRIQSGVLAFDLVTGGGVPIGRFTSFHGDKSTGKSTMSLKIINSFLNNDSRKAVYVDFENTFDSIWASNFIDEMHRLLVFKPDYGEHGVDFILDVSKESSEIGLVIVDSLAMIVPTKEADSDIFSQHIGIQARLVNSMFRRLLPIMSKNNRENKEITYLLINQIRMKIDGYGNPNAITKPCGKMQDAVASLDIRFYAKDYEKVNDIPLSVTYQINVEKNKVGGLPKRTAQFTMCLLNHNGYRIGEIKDELFIIKLLRKAGDLVKDGSKWKLSSLEFKNLQEVQKYLKENQDKKLTIQNFLLEKMCSNISLLIEGGEEDAD